MAHIAEGHVLPDRQGLHQAEVLVDHADAASGGIDRVDDLDLDAVQADLTGIGQDQPDEDLHQASTCQPRSHRGSTWAPMEPVHAARRHLPEPLGDADEPTAGSRAPHPRAPVGDVMAMAADVVGRRGQPWSSGRSSAGGEGLGRDLPELLVEVAGADGREQLVHGLLPPGVGS